jgi:hypothetical protein
MHKLVISDSRNSDGEVIVKEKAIYSDEAIPRCSKCLDVVRYGSWVYYCTYDKTLFCDKPGCKRKMCRNYVDHIDFYGELKKMEVKK